MDSPNHIEIPCHKRVLRFNLVSLPVLLLELVCFLERLLPLLGFAMDRDRVCLAHLPVGKASFTDTPGNWDSGISETARTSDSA